MNSIKIFFICPTNTQPSGGVKQIYRMVDVLNKNGFEAFVLHHKRDYRETWFPNETRVIYHPYLFKLIKYVQRNNIPFSKRFKLKYLKKISLPIDENSIIVFPEIYASVRHIEPSAKKVIFNQNCYYTFLDQQSETEFTDLPYNDPKTLATIVVSEDSKNYLESFTNNVFRVRLAINDQVFDYSDKKNKEIAFMPRKLPGDINQVLNIFRLRNPDSKWIFNSIDNKSEDEVAAILKKSLIFLCFNEREGFGLPPVEAMSCGCYVIGYRGQAGKEYFKNEFSSAVDDGNIIEFVYELEKAIASFEDDAEKIISKGKIASEFVKRIYNAKNEEQDIITIWTDILKK